MVGTYAEPDVILFGNDHSEQQEVQSTDGYEAVRVEAGKRLGLDCGELEISL